MTRASGKRKRAPGDAGRIGGLRNLAKRSRPSPTKRNDPIVSPHDLDVPGVFATGTMQTTMFSLPDTSDGDSIQYAPDAVSGSSRIVPMDRAITSLSDVVSAWSDTSSVASTLDLRLHGSDSEESSVGQASSSPSRLRPQPTRKAKKNGRLDQSADSDFSISRASSAFDVVPGSTRHHSGHDSDSTLSSRCSSPGFEVIETKGHSKGPKRWEPATWPEHVERLHGHITPAYFKYASVSAESKRIAICKSSFRGGLGLVATRAIPKDTIIGEYFGKIEVFGPPCANGYRNNGYMLHLKTPAQSGQRYGIDAREAGGLFRLANHACNPCARFHEVQTGRHLTVAVATVRDVFPGDEITDLLFIPRSSIKSRSNNSRIMTRGRRTGYANYSVREQLLLCAIAEKIVPTGRNEWERLTIRYNSRRGRSSLERDLDSLRRKFKNLYNKPKPSGNGEVKPAHKAIMWAEKIQMTIEEKAGTHTSFDGVETEEDEEKENQSQINRPASSGGVPLPHLPVANGCREGHTSVSQERDPVGSSPASKEKNVVSQLAKCSKQSQSPIPEAQYSGIAITSSGTFDASLAAALGLSDSDEDEEEREEEPCANDVDGDNVVTFKRPQGVTEEVPQRSAGRPPKPTPTTPPMTSPDGAVLFRDPGRAVADAREKARNPRLSSVSNRLGGQDLTVVRDNIEELTKRTKTAKRIENLGKQITGLEEAHGSDTNDMTRLLIFYRAESDRKAETAELRRHEEKAQRDAVEKREKEERERARQDESDRLREERADRLVREEKWKAEKEENRRQFEARMELERSEARERHSEMMMMLAKLINK
ncbi:SET domain-containing protein [Phytophthora infestans]|uniref:SET domain-containing protein n=1 Tax=Phytophthora infestans TaxID=4787 RepID=A0A833T089_PHYIN|nr:SET domain-containing protein [Phytophthora infestans]